MTNIAIIKLYQFTHSPRRQRVDQGQGTRGRRGRRGGHHDLFLFKHAKRPCKLAPGHVMVATHLPLLRDGRRADQVLQWPGATLELLPSTIWVRLRFKPLKLDLGGVFFLLFAIFPQIWELLFPRSSDRLLRNRHQTYEWI